MPIEPGGWDRPLNGDRRRSGYGAKWSTTERELADECSRLGADEVVIGLALQREQIRLDGWPKSGVDVPDEVIVYVPRSAHGPLRFLSDRWYPWRDNVRAVVLTLQRLRLVTESGVAQSGEQYKGWAALPPGSPAIASGEMSLDDALALLKQHASKAAPGREFIVLAGDHYSITQAFKHAVKVAHPDAGGDPAVFAQLTAARERALVGAG